MSDFRLLLLMIFVVSAPPDPARADRLFRCEAKDAVVLGADGRIERTVATEYWRESHNNMIVDTSTGAIRYPEKAEPDRWEIVQAGNASNDFVVVPNPAPSMAATDFLRVRAWAEMKGTVLFIKYGLSMMITGTCTSIQ